jgi:hypothetical protein
MWVAELDNRSRRSKTGDSGNERVKGVTDIVVSLVKRGT